MPRSPLLPNTNEQLKPQVSNQTNVKMAYDKSKKRQEKYYNKHAKKSAILRSGDNVRVQLRSNKWEPAMIQEKTKEPRSYIVKTPEGAEYRRNRRHILKQNQQGTVSGQ